MSDTLLTQDHRQIQGQSEKRGKQFGQRIALSTAGGEFRGLGVGEDLLSRLLQSCRSLGFRSLVLDLPVTSDSFSRVLLREGFAVFETRYRIDLDLP